MKTNKIEKLEVPDLIVGNVYTNKEQVDTINKINEIIDVLNSWIFEPTLTIPNQSQKQLKNKKNVEWKDGDILTTIDKDGLVHYFVLKDMAKLEKQNKIPQPLPNKFSRLIPLDEEVYLRISFGGKIGLDDANKLYKDSGLKEWVSENTLLLEKLLKLLKEEK